MQVSEADNGHTALTMLREATAYDLVLMDVNMPVLDGYTATEQLRADRDHPNWNVLVAAYTSGRATSRECWRAVPAWTT